MTLAVPYRLTKSTFLLGATCLKAQWWRAREPDAPELRETAGMRHRMEEGLRVGVAARERFAGGYLVARGGRSLDAILEDSRGAIVDGSIGAVFEAGFIADGVLVFADVLERDGDRFTVIEVKGTTSVSDEHVLDLALQAHVLGRAGVRVGRCEVMHLNRECRYPDLSKLFVREDVTEQVRGLEAEVARMVREQLASLGGASLPQVTTGEQCSGWTGGGDCPFWDRCWPEQPAHHVDTLYRISKKQKAAFAEAGWVTIHDLPDDVKLSAIAARQRRSVRSGSIVVEREALVAALELLQHPVAHLDFETVAPAIPVWNGCRPYDNVPVQLSCHVVRVDGSVEHRAWIWDGSGDPLLEAGSAIASACAGARTVTAYNASFEKKCIELVASACAADVAVSLLDVRDRMVDLLPVVRESVYHPEFGGSFSLKKVLPALVPGLSYEGLVIAEGETASAELWRLVLGGAGLSEVEKAEMREALLAYCARDTEAMVGLVGRLGDLASSEVRVQ